jgi:uncharacterized membrane protein YfcA
MVLVLTLVLGAGLGAFTVIFYCRKNRSREIVTATSAAAVALGTYLLATRFEAAIQFALAYLLVVGAGGLGACLGAKSNKKDPSP